MLESVWNCPDEMYYHSRVSVGPTQPKTVWKRWPLLRWWHGHRTGSFSRYCCAHILDAILDVNTIKNLGLRKSNGTRRLPFTPRLPGFPIGNCVSLPPSLTFVQTAFYKKPCATPNHPSSWSHPSWWFQDFNEILPFDMELHLLNRNYSCMITFWEQSMKESWDRCHSQATFPE